MRFTPDTLRLVSALREPVRLGSLDLPAWERLLRLARRANLLGTLAERAQRAGVLERLPVAVLPHLHATLRLVAHQREAVRREIAFLAEALVRVEGPAVLLKGAAYAASGRAAAIGRQFGDIDLLVARDALPSVESELLRHGWSAGAIDPYDDRYYRRWMHELPPLAHAQRGTLLDVHHHILPLTTRRLPPVQALLCAAVPLPGSRFSVLAPADMVIHSAVHLFHEGETRHLLRDLVDLDALLTEFGAADPGFAGRLVARAAELHLIGPVALALRYTAALLGTVIEPAVRERALAEAAVTGLRGRAFDAMYRHGFAPSLPGSGSVAAGAAASALYLRSHALRMPPALLALHLGRKAVMRLVRHSSRAT